MRFNNLDDWLAWQQMLHPSSIELGLQRVGEVARRLGLTRPDHVVITVGGTNGKGSCVAMLESVLSEAGYRVGAFTSPHLLSYTERVHVARQPVSEAALCEAFERVDRARGNTSLSYFEFGTLAAMHIFATSGLDVALLEVGLGGRLDAVNVQDANLAVLASIGLDHMEWLGQDREAIGFEKAGVMRARVPAVCGDPEPPASIAGWATEIGAPLYRMGVEFGYVKDERAWTWYCADARPQRLPLPGLYGEAQLRNAASVLTALHLLSERLPVTRAAIEQGLQGASLPGRFQRLPGAVEVILDVAHNPASARVLAEGLDSLPAAGRTHAVLAVLADKDAGGIVASLIDQVDAWYVAAAASQRTRSVDGLHAVVAAHTSRAIARCAGVGDAYAQARASAVPGDRIVVLGSTFTVAEVLKLHVYS